MPNAPKGGLCENKTDGTTFDEAGKTFSYTLQSADVCGSTAYPCYLNEDKSLGVFVVNDNMFSDTYPDGPFGPHLWERQSVNP